MDGGLRLLTGIAPRDHKIGEICRQVGMNATFNSHLASPKIRRIRRKNLRNTDRRDITVIRENYPPLTPHLKP